MRNSMSLRAVLVLSVAAAILGLAAGPAWAASAITIISTEKGFADSTKSQIATTHLGTTLVSYNATGADKLVIAIATEAGFNGNTSDVTGLTFNGVAMTQIVQANTRVGPGDVGTAEIWYLDNPFQGAGTFTFTYTSSGGGINGGFVSIIGLAGTGDGSAGIGDTDAADYSVGPITSSITTTGSDSLVIAMVENSGNNNAAGTPTVDAPLTLIKNGVWGSQWGSSASGYQFVSGIGTTITPTFTTNTGAAYTIHTVAVEFLAAFTTLFWDISGVTPGAGGSAPAGTWNAANTNWNAVADGTGSTAAWAAGQTACFAAGTDATGTYTVTVDGTQDIGGLTFEDGTVTLTGGALRMTGDSIANVASGLTATVETPISEDVAGRQLIKRGNGTLILSGANAYSGGTTVGAGVLRLGAADVLPDTGAVTVAGNAAGATATLDLNGNNDTIGSLTLGGATATSGAAVTTGAAALTLGGNVTYNSANNPLGATISGKLELGAPRTFTVNDSTSTASELTVSADISGTGFGLIKEGAGRLVLSGNNALATGGMALNAGITQFESTASINGTERDVTVNSAGVVVFGASFGAGNIPAALLTRIVDSSAGVIAADNYAGTNFDFNTAGLMAAYLGAVGNVTYTGTLTPNGTTYRLGGGGGVLTMTNDSALTGTGKSVIVNGNVVLSGANDYDGATTIKAGVLQANNATALGSGGDITFTGGTLQYTAASAGQDWGARMKNSTAGAINLDTNGQTVTLAGIIDSSNTAVLAKLGAGTLTLSNNNTYTGGTTVNAGTLVLSGSNNTSGVTLNAATLIIGNAGALGAGTFTIAGAGTVQAAGTITITNAVAANSNFTIAGTGALTLGDMTLSAARTITNSNTTSTTTLGAVFGSTALTFAGNGSTAVTGSINTGTGALTKGGTGTLSLTNATNTYTGVTTISAGVLEAAVLANGGSPSSIGMSTNAAARLVFGAPAATLRYTGSSNVTIDRGFTLSSGAGGGATIESSGSGTLSINNTVALAYGTAAQTRLLTLGGTNTGGNTFAKVIGNNTTSATSLTKAGTGTWILSGANTYTGATTVNAGTLSLTGSLTATAITTSGTGILDESAAGVIGGAASITQNSSGTSILSGANTYSGATTVNAGTLVISGSPTGTGAVTVSGGTLDLGGGTATGSLASTVLNLGGGTFAYTRTGNTTQNFTTTNIIAGAGLPAISVAAVNILNLGTIVGAGGTIDFAGTGEGTVAALEASNIGGIIPSATFGNTWAVANGAGSAITSLAAYTLTSVALNDPAQYAGVHIDVDSSQTPTALIMPNSLRLNTAGASTTTLQGTNVLTSGGILVTSAVGANLSTITGGTIAGAASGNLVVIQNNTNTGGGLTIASNIVNNTGATGLIKSGAGLLTITGANTYTGATTVGVGTLEIGGAGQLNSGNYSAAIAVAGGATFKYNSSANQILGGAISGDGGLAKDGAGNLTLSAVNTYTGATTITTGTLEIGGAGQLGGGTYSNTITISPGATFKYNSDANQTFSSGGSGGVIRGSGSFIKDGTGTLTVSEDSGADPSSNLFTGPITINKGVLRMYGDYAFYNNACTYTIASGAVLHLDDSTYIPVGTTTINGAGTLLITGDDFYSYEAGDYLTLSLGSGGLIDVRAGGGGLWNGYATDESITWTANRAKLNVDGLFDLWNGKDVFVDALTGAGTVQRTKNGRVITLTVGVDNGSGTFSGTITNGVAPATVYTAVAFTKTGSGTQTLTGVNTYSGATLVSAGTLAVSGTGALTATSGITINGPTAVFMQNSSVPNSRTFTLTQGTLGGTGTISKAITSGANVTIAPGDRTLGTPEAGVLTIANAVNLTGGATEMRLFSATGSDMLVQSTTGGLTYGGILKITDCDPLAFAIGNNWDLFDFASQSGSFSNDSDFGTVGGGSTYLPLLTIGKKWSFNYTTGVLSVALGLIPGDADKNGVVDAADYITVKQNFGMTTGATWEMGNFDSDIDGNVDWDDLQLLMANFGTRSVGGAPATPEPATLGLLAIGALAVLRRRRRA